MDVFYSNSKKIVHQFIYYYLLLSIYYCYIAVYRERTLSGEGLNKINEYVYIDILPCLMNNEPVILAKEEDVWASVHEKDANEKLRILDQFEKVNILL